MSRVDLTEKAAYQREWKRKRYEAHPELRTKENAEATRKRTEKRRNDPEFRAREAETARRYRLAHPERAREHRRSWYRRHRDRVIADNTAYYQKNKQMLKARSASRRYGISVEEYFALLAACEGVCSICKNPERLVLHGQVVPLALDHDHATNRARGFLCSGCNRALGMFGDSPERLRAAAIYVENAA